MIDLAISVASDAKGTTIIETNHGVKFKSPRWPQDCEFQLVAFTPSAKTCEIISSEQLAHDIRQALAVLDSTGSLAGPKPDWYRRLIRCAKAEAST